MDVIVIFGPPAVGKMAVGMELAAKTGFKLFHNHHVIELLLNFFEYGSPGFNRLRREFRMRIIEELGKSACHGIIFTYVWALDCPEDEEELKHYFTGLDVTIEQVKFIELYADQKTRLERNSTPLRLAEKKSKRDTDWSAGNLLQTDARYRLNSEGDFPYPHHLWIDNSGLGPGEVADIAISHFNISDR
jgi:hypothetical protein